MFKNYNKLVILSVILLIYSILVLAVGFPLFDKISNKINYADYYFNISYFKKIDYMNILFYFLFISYFLSLLMSVIIGIIGLIKIRKTKEKGEIIATLSVAISSLVLFGNIYVGWGFIITLLS